MGRMLWRAVGFGTILLWPALRANSDASWLGQPYSLAIGTHFSTRGQSSSGSVALTLQHDVPCTLAVSVSSGGDEVLTLGSGTLSTSYKLTGAALQNPDGTWVSSSDFLTQTYNVQGTGPADTITLWVQGTAPSNQAPDAGVYSAAIILTASW